MALTRKLQHPYSEKATKSKPPFGKFPSPVSLEGNLVEGKIDLLFADDGNWGIVDYKTDDVSREALEQRFQSYEQQGPWYARAVRQAPGHKVKEVDFFFVRSGEVWSVQPNEESNPT